MKKRLVATLLAVVLVCGVTSCDLLEDEGGGENVSAGSKEIPVEDIRFNAGDLYLNWQYKFADTFDISLEKFKEQKEVAQWLKEARAGTAYQANESFSLFSEEKQYKLTASSGDYTYYGETKDNYPHGIGMLLYGSGLENVENIRYIGYFSEGRFDGYGLLFEEPENDSFNVFYGMVAQGKVAAADLSDQYHGFVNYVAYEGEFDKGAATGRGNDFYCWLALMIETPGARENGFAPSKIPFVIKVGKFKDGQANGEISEYSLDGSLYYKGKQKNGQPHGSGTLYFSNGTIKYEGEFKDGQYHGKGTLFDQEGNVVYDGKWAYGDYK